MDYTYDTPVRGGVQEIYNEIRQQVNSVFERQVLDLFVSHIGESLRREYLIEELSGRRVERAKLAADHDDRKLRMAISNLQRAGVPILSSASEAGYVLVDDDERLDAYVCELESRRAELADKIAGLRKSRPLVRAIRELPRRATQPSLFG